MILTKEHFADVNSRVQSGELTPGEGYKLFGRIQSDQENYKRITAEDRLEMVRLYTEEKLGCAAIAKLLKCSQPTVQHHLEQLGIKIRDRWTHRSTLTDDDVREIRASTEPQSVLARRFNVDQATISNIKNRKSRANVPDIVLPEGLEGTRQALNMLPAKNEALQSELKRALKLSEQTGHLLKTVSNVS